MISASSQGVTISIIKITKNKKFECPEDCWSSNSCPLKSKCSLHPNDKNLIATEITLSVVNATNDGIQINPQANKWQIVDSEGFSSGCVSFCEKFIGKRFINPDSWMTVVPKSKVRFSLAFPELEPNIEIIALIFNSCGIMIRLQIAEPSSDIAEMFNQQDSAARKSLINKDWALKAAVNDTKELKASVFSRFHNTLTNKERIKLDNTIQNLEFSISEYLKSAKPWQAEIIKKDFEDATREYNEKILSALASENACREIDQKVEQLYELTPREFEEWTQSLFVALGFDNVILTSQTNDGGIDVFAEKGGLKIAVQCKKIKGLISRPTVQAFLGAMQSAEVDKGYFITTGTFSIGAEKMVESLPIELYDKVSLRKLIGLALNTQQHE